MSAPTSRTNSPNACAPKLPASATLRYSLASTKKSNFPLAAVLARMEYTGIRIDGAELDRLSAMLETQHRGTHQRNPRAGGLRIQYFFAAATR